MKEYYDFSKGVKKPHIAENMKKNGYTVRVTRGEGEDMKIVEERFISPEEVATYNKKREQFLEKHYRK